MASKYFLEVDSEGRILARYDDGIHGVIPSKAKSVSQKVFQQSLETRKGFEVFFLNGAITFQEIAGVAESAERSWRNRALDGIKWLRERHRDELEIGIETTLSPDQFGELLNYIQQLREWPQSDNFPKTAMRPVSPEWLKN